jgi:hypothetical protein
MEHRHRSGVIMPAREKNRFEGQPEGVPDEENPERAAEMFARARAASEVWPALYEHMMRVQATKKP